MADEKRLLSGIFAGPIAFALVFELKYALVDYVCRNRAQWLFWIFFALGLLICAYGAWQGARRAPLPVGAHGVRPDRARFMSLGGLALSIAFAVFIVALMVPDLFLRPCQ
jgi:hypothetical protein